MPAESTIQRLAFIRYLYSLAVEQSRTPEPLNAVAILMFHDAVELALHLALEHNEVSANNPNFGQYFELLEQKLSIAALPGREAMRRLNKSRVALKHHGALPAQRDIEGFRASVTAFFEENVPILFGLAFAEVSLATLVVNEPARQSVQRADQLRAEGKNDDAAEALAVAFEQLLHSARFDPRAEFKLPYLPRLSRHDFEGLTGEFRSLIQALVKSVEQLQEEVQLLRLGIDASRLRAFRRFVPHAAVAMSGVYDTWRKPNAPTRTDAEVQFCYFFVIESALKLQRIESLPA